MQVAPVTTSELRAVSAELKQQWLSSTQNAHQLLSAMDDGSGVHSSAPNTVAITHLDDEKETETEAKSSPPFVRRGRSLRDKLRSTVTEARTESRYFS